MRIGLGIFHHDPFGFLFTATKFRASLEHFIYNTTRVIGGLEVDIEIAPDCLNVTDAIHASDLRLYLLGDFLGLLRHWDFFPFAGARLVGGGLEK